MKEFGWFTPKSYNAILHWKPFFISETVNWIAINTFKHSSFLRKLLSESVGLNIDKETVRSFFLHETKLLFRA